MRMKKKERKKENVRKCLTEWFTEFTICCNVEGQTMEISKSVGIKSEQQEHLVAKSAVINKLIRFPFSS